MGVKNDGVGTNRTTKHNKLVFWPLCNNTACESWGCWMVQGRGGEGTEEKGEKQHIKIHGGKDIARRTTPVGVSTT